MVMIFSYRRVFHTLECISPVASFITFSYIPGGIIENRIVTADQLKEFANYTTSGGLDGARSKLVGILHQVRGQELIRKFNSHQTDLVVLLQQHSKAAELISKTNV
ncbi:unnamed protein product [Echinostoma caproni]|uniref:CARD domain-containing protein n=1 Tax=Echinostoma caproni TaxID=27848 RepID=A0A183BE28_9TREM|nr:unnamed protein product [Echinostoma caproni]